MRVLLVAIALMCCSAPAGATVGSTVDQFGRIRDLAAGSGHVCVANHTGKVYCWGESSSGRLAVPNGVGDVIQLVAKGLTTCSLNKAGEVYCWGGLAGNNNSAPITRGVERIWSRGETGFWVWTSDRHLVMHSYTNPSTTYLNLSIPDQLGDIREASDLYYHHPDADALSHICVLNQQNQQYCLQGSPAASWVLQPGSFSYLGHYCIVTINGQADCDPYGVGAFPAPSRTIGFVEDVLGLSASNLPEWVGCAWGTGDHIRCNSPGPMHSNRPVLKNVRKIVVGLDGQSYWSEYQNMMLEKFLSVRWFACALAAGDLVRCWGTKQAGQLGPGPQNETLADSHILIERGLAWPSKAYDIKHSWHNKATAVSYRWQKSQGRSWQNINSNGRTEIRITRSLLGKRIRFCSSARNKFARDTICSVPSPKIKKGDVR